MESRNWSAEISSVHPMEHSVSYLYMHVFSSLLCVGANNLLARIALQLVIQNSNNTVPASGDPTV